MTGKPVVADRELIRADEVALIVGLSLRAVQMKAARGELPGFRLPHTRVWLFRESAVRAWVAEAERRAARLREYLARGRAPPPGATPPGAKTNQGKAEAAAEARLEQAMARRRASKRQAADAAPGSAGPGHYERLMSRRRRADPAKG